jgi:chemotaxis protein CheC
MKSAASEIQQSVLKELGNIGAGHAATALAELIGSSIGLTEPRVQAMPMDHCALRVRSANGEVAALQMAVWGDAPAEMLIIFDRDESMMFVRRFLEKQLGAIDLSADVIDSALREIAHIIGGSYLTAIVDMIGIELLPSAPQLTYGKLDAILESVIDSEDEHEAFVISNGFINERGAINAEFFLIPQTASLGAYMQAFGLGA